MGTVGRNKEVRLKKKGVISAWDLRLFDAWKKSKKCSPKWWLSWWFPHGRNRKKITKKKTKSIFAPTSPWQFYVFVPFLGSWKRDPNSKAMSKRDQPNVWDKVWSCWITWQSFRSGRLDLGTCRKSHKGFTFAETSISAAKSMVGK